MTGGAGEPLAGIRVLELGSPIAGPYARCRDRCVRADAAGEPGHVAEMVDAVDAVRAEPG